MIADAQGIAVVGSGFAIMLVCVRYGFLYVLPTLAPAGPGSADWLLHFGSFLALFVGFAASYVRACPLGAIR